MTRIPIVAASLLISALPAFTLPALAQAALSTPAPAPAASTARGAAARSAARPDAGTAASAEKIVAVVNGDVITSGDVVNRGRLFALSSGLPVTPEVLERLRPQIVKQLVDERLRLQETQRRKIAVTDKEIADAIGEIEQRNGMAAGSLGNSLRGQGVAYRTLIDQVRVQLGWTRVLRQEMGSKAEITEADVADQDRMFKLQIGKPEYRVAEIFIPIDEPSKAGEAQRFADAVIQQLRSGAPFGVAAAQFSQSQTALQGGDLGWVGASELDPSVATVVREMPVGAISNPTRVPGGISIVTLRAKRDVGRDRSTVVSLRQAFYNFTSPLNPAAPTEQQRRQVELSNATAKSAHSCKDVEDANQKAGNSRPSDPGEVRLEGVGSTALRNLLGTLPIGQGKSIVTGDGAAVVMVCSREEKAAAAPSKEEITNRLLQERAELTSRQLQRDLRRRAVLEERSS